MLQATDWNQLRIPKNNRALFIGATGCGKTTLAKYLIEDPIKPFSVVYDAKISENITGWNDRHKFYYNLNAIEEAEERRLIYRPSVYESLNPKLQDDFFAWVYNRLHTRVYVDEAYALLGGTNPSFHLQACLSRGRERGISTFISTQRPKRIPLLLLSESEHIFVFRLNMLEDRIRVFELTGIDPMEQTALRPHQFIYYDALSGDRTNTLTLNLE